MDIGNAVSLKYLVPLGAHDIDSAEEDICLRFSKEGDTFLPFGENELELLGEDELIYSVGNKVKQEDGYGDKVNKVKLLKKAKYIFPIDGFKDKNYDNVINARDELAEILKKNFNCEIKVGFVDINNTEFEF